MHSKRITHYEECEDTHYEFSIIKSNKHFEDFCNGSNTSKSDLLGIRT